MKSPLVEALRQANGSKSTSAGDESEARRHAADDSTDTAAARRAPDAEELELMESARLLQAGHVAHDREGDTSPFGTTGLDGANDAARPDDSHGSDEESPPNALPTAARRARIAKLGFFAPLLGLGLAVAAGGANFAVQGVGGWYHNTDLDSLPSQPAPGSARSVAIRSPAHAAGGRFALLPGSGETFRSAPDLPADGASTAAPEREIPEEQAESSARRAEVGDRAIGALNVAYEAYERGDFAAAESAYRRALQLAPRHPSALRGLAAILQRTGRQHESLALFETLLAVEPENPEVAAVLLAGRTAASGSGESDVKLLIQRHPGFAHLQFTLGTLLAEQSRWVDARSAFAEAVRLDAGNADYLYNLAVSLEHLGRSAEARRFYTAAADAAGATSTLDLDVVSARIEELEQPPSSENQAR